VRIVKAFGVASALSISDRELIVPKSADLDVLPGERLTRSARADATLSVGGWRRRSTQRTSRSALTRATRPHGRGISCELVCEELG